MLLMNAFPLETQMKTSLVDSFLSPASKLVYIILHIKRDEGENSLCANSRPPLRPLAHFVSHRTALQG